MRCPKCQYLGFEPSPRCKNCGFDFAFSEDTGTLTLVADPEAPPAMADFDLQILDDAPRTSASRRSFDLDELLATGRAASDPPPVTLELQMPDPPAANVTAVAVSSTPPPEEVERIVREAGRVFDEPEPVVQPAPEPEPEPAPAPLPAIMPVAPVARANEPEPPSVRVRTPPPTPPVTTELPLFMQATSTAPPAPTPEIAAAPVASATVATTPVAASATVTTTPPAASAAVTTTPVAASAAVTTTPVAASAAVTTTPPAAPAADGKDDVPLVRVPARPRAPLSVRRTTPDPSALRAKYARPMAPASGDLLRDIDPPAVAAEPVAADRPATRLSAEPTPSSLPAEWLAGAPTGARIGAAALDAVLLGAINALVVWLTLSVCGLTPAEAHLLPIVPLAVFFVVLDGGYLVLFTAACGQTLGKMAAGIRVVGTTTGAVINDRLSIGQAFARAISALASVLPLGAGFWMALAGDHRALHDRIAHTRVVRA